ncbi:MAG: hypothetical protein PHS44_06785 [Candidatus Dojkabacteria bacterium]|jgi:hypothetical protein|nr:hypothetical protein [Candidatus Dojkabacteria bacterium]
MQEFTIPTQPAPAQDNDPLKQTLPPIPDSDVIPDENKLIKPKKKEGKVNCLVTILVILNVVSFAIAGVFAYLYFTDSNLMTPNRNSSESSATSQSTTTTTQQTPAKMYYTDKYNIFESEATGKNPAQLTQYNTEERGELRELELIDDSFLGFVRCLTAQDSVNCVILSLNPQTKEVKTVNEIDDNKFLENISWQDKDRYVYSIVDGTNLSINYFNGSTSQELKTIALPEGSRGKFIEDDARLRFSPEKDKFLSIYTTARTGFDFTIDVIDLEGDLIAKIKNATNPVWIDNDHIVYRKYSNNEAGYLYNYDLETQLAIRVEKSTSAAYSPKVFGNKMVFWDATGLGKTNLLDFDKNELTAVSENSAYIIWLSDKEVIFAKTRACQTNECDDPESLDYINQFVTEKYYIYNFETKSETEIELSKDLLENGILTSANKHI